MRRSESPTPGGSLELSLLQVLWDEGESTARALYKRVGESRGIVYTTVAKVLDRLATKRMVRRRRQGRAWVYTARIRCSETQRAMAREFIESLVRSGPRPAVAALVGAMEDVSPDLLDELAAELRAAKEREGEV